MELVVECNIKEPRNSRRNQLKDRFIYRVLHMPDKDGKGGKEHATRASVPALTAMANSSTRCASTDARLRHSDSCVQHGTAGSVNGYLLVGGPGGGPAALMAIAPPLTTIKAPSASKRLAKSEPDLQANSGSSDESIDVVQGGRSPDINSVDWSGGPDSSTSFVHGDVINLSSGTFLVLGPGSVLPNGLTTKLLDDEMLDFEQSIELRQPIRPRSQEGFVKYPVEVGSRPCASETQQVGLDPTRGPTGTLGRQLMLAASEGKLLESWRLLILGANANFYAPGGWTPLHRAAARGHSDISALLLKRGAMVNAKSSYGITPLLCAANGDHVGRCVSLLLANGAKVDCRDRGGRTPLHYAAKEGNLVAVKNLLMAGADKNARDHTKRAPRDIAKTKKVWKLLL